MTQLGFLCSVSRHGMKRAQVGPLLRASFEETADVFFESASYGTIDPCKSMTSSIMFGKCISSGTGSFGIVKAKKKKAPIFLGRRKKTATSTVEKQRHWNPFLNPLAKVDFLLREKKQKAQNVANAVMGFSGGPMGGPMHVSNEGEWDMGNSMQMGSMQMGSFPNEMWGVNGPTRPKSPDYLPTSPDYSPTSPAYLPQSPKYSPPKSPDYSPTHPPSPSPPKYDGDVYNPETTYGPYDPVVQPLETHQGDFDFDQGGFVPLSPPLQKEEAFVPLSPPMKQY